MAKFSQLVTAAVKGSNTQFLTSIPTCMLEPTEKKQVDFIAKCLGEGWMPTLDDLREELHFLPVDSNKPLKILFNDFTKKRRETYIAEQLAKFVEKNEKDGEDPYTGLVEFQLKILEKTAIGNPDIINYGKLPREAYVKNVYRSSFHLVYFDEMTQGLNGGDFVVIMAGTKGYKTTLLKLMTQAAYYAGEDVVFCSQEQAVMSMSQQFDMQALNKTHSNLRAGISEEQLAELKEIEKQLAEMDNELFITPQVTSVAQLHQYIISLNKPIKRVFIDGLNLMQGDSADSYNSLQKVCADLKRYAIDNNLIIIAVTQTNREGYKSGTSIGAQHVAGSFAISMYADLMIALSPLPEAANHIYIRAILNRHGDLLTKIRFVVDYTEDGHFWTDLALLTKEFGTEQVSDFSIAKEPLKIVFEKEHGISFEAMKKELGDAGADALLSFAAELDEQAKIFDLNDESDLVKF